MDQARLNRFINQPLREVPLEAPALVTSSQSVRQAVAAMQAGKNSCVLVMDGERLAGIFTERDVLVRCMADGFDWDQPLSASVYTDNPRIISSDRTRGEAIAVFQQHSYRTLPVVADGRVVGLFRVGDVLAHLTEAFPEELLNLPPRPHQVMEKQEGG